MIIPAKIRKKARISTFITSIQWEGLANIQIEMKEGKLHLFADYMILCSENFQGRYSPFNDSSDLRPTAQTYNPSFFLYRSVRLACRPSGFFGTIYLVYTLL